MLLLAEALAFCIDRCPQDSDRLSSIALRVISGVVGMPSAMVSPNGIVSAPTALGNPEVNH